MDYETRIKNYFLLLKAAFPEFNNSNKKIFQPTEDDFPFSWKDPLKAADNILKLLARHLGLNPNRIELMFYEQYPKEDVENYGSLYLRFKNDKKANIRDYDSPIKRFCLNIDACVLKNAAVCLAVVARELCYLKLLLTQPLNAEDGKLVDIAAIYFGFENIIFQVSKKELQLLNHNEFKKLESLDKKELEFAITHNKSYKVPKVN